MRIFQKLRQFCLPCCLALLLLLSACRGENPALTTAGPTLPATASAIGQGTTAGTTVPNTTDATSQNTTEEDEPMEPSWILNTTNKRSYTQLDTGVVMRKIIIKTHLGGPAINISHMTDTHIVYYSEEDLQDPIYQQEYTALGGAGINGWPLSNVQATMNVASRGTDMVVVTGDVLASYSPGALKKTQEYIFDAYDHVMATLGNHDSERTRLEDPISYEDRRQLLAQGWCNDITYASEVLENKVMLIAMDNSFGFRSEQVPLLTEDLAKARENGWIVLMFYHVPLNSGLESDNNIAPEWGTHENWSFGTASGCVGPNSKGVDAKIYSMIRRNGDIIRGLFCGHVHGDFYIEIPAKTIDGVETMIPQYVTSPVYSDKGHFFRIVVQ